MQYLSTRNNKLKKTFIEVLFQGLSNEGGLFLPIKWPSINNQSLHNKTYEEVAHCILYPFMEGEVSEQDLSDIINSSYINFTNKKIAPLVNIDKNKYILELFYGPTLAFKDYALQFLGELFSHCLKYQDKNITVLGATSGDTGSAAIDAFKGKSNINVFILHPHNRVSEVQRKQMTTNLDNNIFNIAVDGTFDDCQKIVKELFVDSDIHKKTSLTAINSINWARIMAQTIYYYWAYLQLKEDQISFIIPSGNFGNTFSAYVAKQMGLPINELHVVTNQNDILNQIISFGKMNIKNVIQTHSPSMDIQISSNFERQIFNSVNYSSDRVIKIIEEFNSNNNYIFDKVVLKNFQNIYKSYSISNNETLETIKLFNQKYNYLSDPHTATGLTVLNNIKTPSHSYVSLACAHPAKFSEAIKEATGQKPLFPEKLDNIFDKKEKMTIISNNSKDIKSFIIQNL